MPSIPISVLITWAVIVSCLYLCSGMTVVIIDGHPFVSKPIYLGREEDEWRSSAHSGVQWRNEDYCGYTDVFLSHSGKQKNFVRQLYRDLRARHVSCFFDEYSLPFTEKFPPLIFKAAERCKIAVVVLSKEFIRSKWPMIELSAFIRAMKSGSNANLKLLPIFFMISPKELSQITKDNPEWQKLEESDDTRGKWQDALKEVRLTRGLQFREDENEVDFRDKVVKEIRRLLQREVPQNQSQSLKFFKSPFRSSL